MSGKPRWSRAGFAARIKVSPANMHLIIEGRDWDPAFYSLLMDEMYGLGNYVIHLVESVNVYEDNARGKPTGGKRAVIDLHDWMLEHGYLAKNAKARTVFALDRDADDLTGQLVESDFVMYTKGYDVEAEIVLNADPIKAFMSTFSLTRQEASDLHGFLGDWVEEMARRWSNWISFCLVSKQYKISCGVSFSRPSCIQDPHTGQADSNLVNWAKNELLNKCQPLTEEDIDNWAAIFDGVLSNTLGKYHVKGKWLPNYLLSRFRDFEAGRQVVATQESDVIRGSLGALNFSGQWTAHYKKFLLSG